MPGRLYDEFIHAKELTDIELAYVNMPVYANKKGIVGEMNPCKCKSSLLLPSSTLINPCSNTFVESMFTLKSTHLTDTGSRWEHNASLREFSYLAALSFPGT
jgi:hypothetical protein